MQKTNSAGSKHWAEQLADTVLQRFPDASEYVCAAGISPSGVIHFGNFRDVMTAQAVLEALEARGKQTRLLFSWDDFDRFRKVPEGVPASFEEHIGKPLSAVPDPEGKHPSYAKRFEVQFEEAMQALGLKLDYRYQTELYQAGTYDKQILAALKGREKIAAILLSLMSDKSKLANEIEEQEYTANYYPVSIYSKFTGKDFTTITGFDGKRTLEYTCKETGKTATAEVGKDRNIALAWKTDWAMRWVHESVTFEPAGADHASPGSSFDAADRIVRDVFGGEPPVHAAYGFVGVQGAGKMSGSAGTGVGVGQLLEIYEPSLLQWLYVRKQPKQHFSLAFDTEIYRQYDEFDREHTGGRLRPIPFRQAVALGQIVQWDQQKFETLLASLGPEFQCDPASVESRLPRAKAWLEQYNPDQRISLLEKPNKAYAKKLSKTAREHVRTLQKSLSGKSESVAHLERLVYGIAKDPKAPDEKNRTQQREFFKDVYNLLIGAETGPRLSTFLWAIDRKRVLELLNV